MRIARSVVVDGHIEDVFDFVADPLNDPAWCAKVLVVDQVEGDGPGPGAAYEVLHRCLSWERPHRIAWREDDGADVIDVEYDLEAIWTSTRFTQRDEIVRLGAPRILRPLMKAGIRRDIERQLQQLQGVLERR